MAYHPVPTIHFLVGPDMVSEPTRYDRGVKVTNLAPGSQLCQQHADLNAAAGELIKANVALKGAMDAHSTAEATFKTTGTALDNTVVTWDGAYRVFISMGEKYALTENDATSIGGAARGSTIYPLVMPLSVDFKWNPAKNYLRVHVHRAPGMKVTTVQLSPDPITATSWYDLDGSGAIHVVPNPAKGTWWARAQSRTAKAKSDFTTPTSVIVK